MEVPMRWFNCALAGFLALGLAGCGSSSSTHSGGAGKTEKEKKELTNKDKIVGSWELTKSGGGGPPGAVLTFGKDGKLKMSMKFEGKEVGMDGTYDVEGEKLHTTMKDDGKERKETMKIKKLTDTEFVTEDEKGMIDEFKKK
jgi:uncharacterized protein (TIGR03066 family)